MRIRHLQHGSPLELADNSATFRSDSMQIGTGNFGRGNRENYFQNREFLPLIPAPNFTILSCSSETALSRHDAILISAAFTAFAFVLVPLLRLGNKRQGERACEHG